MNCFRNFQISLSNQVSRRDCCSYFFWKESTADSQLKTIKNLQKNKRNSSKDNKILKTLSSSLKKYVIEKSLESPNSKTGKKSN
jgi:hypothetical protein